MRACLALFLLALPLCAAPPVSPQAAFTLSFPNPAAHSLHVRLLLTLPPTPTLDLALPRWTPGYYALQDHARLLSNLRASTPSGQPIPCEQTTPHTWRLATSSAPAVVVEYDVSGDTHFPAANSISSTRAFLNPAATFLHPAGLLATPVSLEVLDPPAWPNISTGLDPAGPRRFTAPDFDTLYDAPLLLGAHERLTFSVRGVPHHLAIEDIPASVSRPDITRALQSIVTAATAIFDDVPYAHYTFLLIGRGAGGIEHSNSSANFFNGASLGSPEGFNRWLSFLAHEYFHAFNVKRLRPLVLGPFDYSRENHTPLLWVSEGLTVYYQDILLLRAGLLTRAQYLERLAASIAGFENAHGRNYQSATEASLAAWSTRSGVAADRDTAISYYSNGALLGALLDIRIRHASANRRSLDDVLRSLYDRFHRQFRRGFTAAEFRAECDRAAGDPAALDPVFTAAASTASIDYPAHFRLAGLTLEVEKKPAPGIYSGLHTTTAAPGPDGQPALTVVDAQPTSPAAASNLKPGDRILTIDGRPATSAELHATLQSRAPGQPVVLRILRASEQLDVQLYTVPNFHRTFRLASSPTSSWP